MKGEAVSKNSDALKLKTFLELSILHVGGQRVI